MENKSYYSLKYTKIGGVTRIKIENGDDIKYLPELDQKMWTVLSCPSKGLEFSQKTLDYLDNDSDGHIRVNEVIAAIEWINKIVADHDPMTKNPKSLPLSNICQDTDEGKKIYNSAKQIVANLKLENEELTTDNTADSTKIFAETKFNGDGVITELSADDDKTKLIIKTIIDKIGKATDRTGADGINKELAEEFFKEADEFTNWISKSKDDANLVPYGDNTSAAQTAYMAIKDKIADYFVRCKLVALDKETCQTLEISKENLAKISEKNLSEAINDIAAYPIARLSDKAILPINEPINPAWEAKFNNVKKLILDIDYPGKNSITEAEWNAIGAKFDAYNKWLADKKGSKVESVGYDTLKDIIDSNKKDEIFALIEKDLAEKDNAESIQAVDKIVNLYCNIFTFLKNFVTFSDFYDVYNQNNAIFQAGKLYIDQRECDLCIKVTDMAKHNATASLSSMYIIYCDCVNVKKGGKMTIAAVITDGSVDNIAIGKNGIFYDREGNDWDATVTKIIDNPISVRDAFWSPYKKFAKFIEEQINKFASSKDKELTDKASTSIAETSTKLTEKPAEAPADAPVKDKKEAFDIAKFCGIFAAIGMAIGAIGGALVACGRGFLALNWWQIILVLAAIPLLISGPSMLLAYMKLRRRNISPLLNANGWAINAHAYVNIMFGATLTKMAKFPYVNVKDPLADKGMPWWKKALIILLILGIIFAALYYNGKLGCIGLPLK